MAALILPSRRVIQPSGPVEVDPRFGITPLGLFVGSSGAVNLANNGPLIPRSAVSFRASAAGIGSLQTANNTALYQALPNLQTGDNWTAIWHGVPIGTPSGSTPAFVGINTSTTSQSNGPISIEYTSSTQLTVHFKSGASASFRTGTFTWANVFGKVVTLVASWSVEDALIRLDIFFDGARQNLIESVISSPTTPTLVGTEQFVVGPDVVEQPTRFINANTVFAGAFSGRIREALLRELATNPWQLFRPIQRRIWVEVGGGGETNYTLTADVGAYTLTGEAATTSRGVRMTGDVGSYALTGQDATTSRGYSLTGDVGAYSLTGESAGTQAGFRIGADTGAYSLTGQDATLTYSQGTTNYTLTAETGNYTLTGVDAGTIAGRRLVADVGAYSLTGQNATTSKGTRLVADSGAYTLTGQDATLTATATVNYTLICETGVYSLDGGAATFDFLVEGVQLLGGGPGLPRKKKRVVRTDLDKDSYLYRLLSPELRQEVPPEVAEVIEEQAAQAVEQPKKPAQAKKDLRSALKDEGIAYREAYREALTLAIQEMQRQDDEEEEAIAVALASLI